MCNILHALLLLGKYCAASRPCTSCRCWNVKVSVFYLNVGFVIFNLIPLLDLHQCDVIFRDLVNLCMSYHPRWLHIGLEAVFAEVIPVPLNDGGEKFRITLQQFVETRLLMDPSLKVKYCAHSKVPSGDSERHYNLEMSQHTLRRFLTLVLFLDKARLVNTIPGPCSPCLFMKEANVKSSEGVLNVFSGFLKGEGSFIQHLKKMGFVVTYKQTAMEEYDFEVKNLAVDLRDGIRLVYLVNAMTGDDHHNLTKDLRVPATSRLQKIHNVDLALSRLESDGHVTIDHPILAKDVVDGHQAMTLKLLWMIISAYQLSAVVNVEALETEACEIVAAWAWRQRWEGVNLEPVADPPMSTTTTKDEGSGLNHNAKEQQQAMSRLDNALLQWINAITSGYGIRVVNFTTSFSDWRALCLLVHYYFPDALPLNKIRRTTVHLPRFDGLTPWDDGDDWIRTVDSSKVTETECKYALEGEKANARLVNACLSDIGGIPASVPVTDSSIHPEEKTTKMIVAFLASRLLDSSMDIIAAIRIQRALRCYFRRTGRGAIVRNSNGQSEKKHSSGIFLFPTTAMNRCCRRSTKQSPSPPLDYTCLAFDEKGKKSTDEERWAVMEAAAARIQVLYRSRLAKAASRCIVHKYNTRAVDELEMREKSLSSAVKKLVLLRKERKRAHTMRVAFLKVRSSTIVIQRAVRKHQARRRLEVQTMAVICIQSQFRMRLAKVIIGEKRYQARQKREAEAATCIQGMYRIRLAKTVAAILGNELRRNQRLTAISGLLQIHHHRKLADAWQRFIQAQQRKECQFLLQCKAATVIQSYYRMILAKHMRHEMMTRRYEAQRNHAYKVIQAFLKSTLKRRAAVSAIQRLIWKRKYRQEQAVVKLQTWWRFHYYHAKYTEMHHAAIVLQSVVRMVLQKRKMYILKVAGTKICKYLVAARDLQQGRYWRKNVLRGIVLVQALVRGFLERTQCNYRGIQVSFYLDDNEKSLHVKPCPAHIIASSNLNILISLQVARLKLKLAEE